MAGVTSRTAAELIDIHRNSAIRFFHKLREKISLKQLNRIEQFCGKIELDKAILAAYAKGKETEELQGRYLYLEY